MDYPHRTAEVLRPDQSDTHPSIYPIRHKFWEGLIPHAERLDPGFVARVATLQPNGPVDDARNPDAAQIACGDRWSA
jgi:hypothetical protein